MTCDPQGCRMAGCDWSVLAMDRDSARSDVGTEKVQGSNAGRVTCPWIYRSSRGHARPPLCKHTWSLFCLKCHISIVMPENGLCSQTFNKEDFWVRMNTLLAIPLYFTVQAVHFFGCYSRKVTLLLSVCLSSLFCHFDDCYIRWIPPHVFTYLGHLLCVALFSRSSGVLGEIARPLHTPSFHPAV